MTRDLMAAGHELGGDMPRVAVVLLHGWGDTADGFLGLGRLIAGPETRVLVPEAPLPGPGGFGAGWWNLDHPPRPRWAWDDKAAAGYEPHPQVTQAREDVLELLADVRRRLAPQRLVLAGFSQGAMLALDAGLRAESTVDAVVGMSGVLLADTLPVLSPEAFHRPPVLLAHGKDDDVVPATGGQAARELLRRNGYDVTWQSFAGGHDVPLEVLDALRRVARDG